MVRKTRTKSPKKCKAPRSARSPKATSAKKTAPEPGPPTWLKDLARDALQSGDLLGATKRAGVSLLDVHQARQRSPEADALIVEVDQLVRLRARAAVEARAATGDLRALTALVDGTLNALDGHQEEQELPPRVGDAMRRAALALMPGGDPTPPEIELGTLCSRCGAFEPTPAVVYFPAKQKATPPTAEQKAKVQR